MSPETYKAALKQAKKELADSVAELGEAQQRAQELENRVADLRQTVSVLSRLCGEEEIELEDALGLTDTIRLVLQDARGQPLTAHDVRLRLEGRGFNTRRYGNLLASIHTVLKRLQQKNEIHRPITLVGNDPEKPAFVWGPGPLETLGFALSGRKAGK